MSNHSPAAETLGTSSFPESAGAVLVGWPPVLINILGLGAWVMVSSVMSRSGVLGLPVDPAKRELLSLPRPRAETAGLTCPGPALTLLRPSEEMEPECANEGPLLKDRLWTWPPRRDELEPMEDESTRRDDAGAEPVERAELGLRCERIECREPTSDINGSWGYIIVGMPNVVLRPVAPSMRSTSCTLPERLLHPSPACGGKSSSTSIEIPRSPLDALADSRHTWGVGSSSPGGIRGRIEVSDDELKDDAGRGAGMSRMSTSSGAFNSVPCA